MAAAFYNHERLLPDRFRSSPFAARLLAAAQGRRVAAEAFAARAAVLELGFLNDRVLRVQALDRLGRARDAREELAAVLRLFHERGNQLGSSGYDKTVWDFDRKEYDRAAGLIGRTKR